MIDKLLLLQKELRNLKNERVIITAPRRSGKTTLLRNIIASYLDREFDKNDIILFAPTKKYSKILGITPITTSSQYRGRSPSLIVVEESAYCNDELLEEMDSVYNCSKVFITTPKPVEYIWREELNDWECTTYVKRLIDQNRARVFSFYNTDFDKTIQKDLNRDKQYFTKKQWDCEIGGKWVE